MKEWSGKLGENYTNRCFRTPEEDNELTRKQHGISRMELNEEFLGDLDRNCKILEVGCNIGNKLDMLQKMGFTNLNGVELQEFAIEKGKSLRSNISFTQGSIFDIPFPDNSFDLIYTSTLLIHISPQELAKAMQEIYRCTKKYIWGFEFFNDELIEIDYRGDAEMMWKGDYANQYIKVCPNLKIVKEKRIPYLEDNNVNCMFLLAKE